MCSAERSCIWANTANVPELNRCQLTTGQINNTCRELDADLSDQYQRVASYVVKLLAGADPATLPVERPTRFELTLNLKTAKALGITIPATVRLSATRVIE